jgi:hypothetical protein
LLSISELESIVAAQAHEPNSGLIVMPEAFLNVHRAEITSLAAHYHLPAVIRAVSSLNSAACCPTEMTRAIIFGARRRMWMKF